MLRKGIIKEKISTSEYLVEDVFDKTEFKVKVSGKQRLGHEGFEKEEEIYFICSPFEPDRCRLVTSTDFKMDESNSLFGKKLELDSKQREKE